MSMMFHFFPLFAMIFHDFPWCIPMIFMNHFMKFVCFFPSDSRASRCQVNASPFQLIWADDAAFLRMESHPARFRYAVRLAGRSHRKR